MAGEDLYIILEIGRTASVIEIKRAFRKLARRYHPDINPGDRHAEERFKRITEAYDILSDPLKREFYDVNGFYTDGVLEQRGSGSNWGFSFQRVDFSRSSTSDFSEIFGHFASRRHQSLNPERGQDVECTIPVSFEESIRGVNSKISVSSLHSCSQCNGRGQAPGSRANAAGAGASLFTVGFCFGGRHSFNQAGRQQGLAGVIGFYGVVQPREAEDTYAPIRLAAGYRCPVLGLFGGADQAIPTAEVDRFRDELAAAGVHNELVTYEGAPHSFFDRTFEQHQDASSDAWRQMLAFIKEHTRQTARA